MQLVQAALVVVLELAPQDPRPLLLLLQPMARMAAVAAVVTKMRTATAIDFMEECPWLENGSAQPSSSVPA